MWGAVFPKFGDFGWGEGETPVSALIQAGRTPAPTAGARSRPYVFRLSWITWHQPAGSRFVKTLKKRLLSSVQSRGNSFIQLFRCG